MRDPYILKNSDVLSNRLNIRDKETLDAAERDITAGKIMQIGKVKGSFESKTEQKIVAKISLPNIAKRLIRPDTTLSLLTHRFQNLVTVKTIIVKKPYKQLILCSNKHRIHFSFIHKKYCWFNITRLAPRRGNTK